MLANARKLLGVQSVESSPADAEIVKISVPNDTVFVSPDFEGAQASKKEFSEIGASFLDTRDLTVPPSTHHQDGQPQHGRRSLIQTKSICFQRRLRASKSMRRFKFGDAERKQRSNTQTILTEIFRHDDSDLTLSARENRPLRNIVLVGHALHNELSAMRNFGVCT